MSDPRTSRRTFLQGGLAAGWLATAQADASPAETSVSGEKPYRVAFFTDVHAREEPEVQEALGRAAERIIAAEPDAVIGGGDYIHGGIDGSHEQGRRRWAVFERFMERLRAGLPGRPIELMLGNHDLAGARPKDGSAPVADPKAMFRSTVGRETTFTAFDLANYRVFLLDSIEFLRDDAGPYPYRGTIDSGQVTWLEDEIAKLPKERPVILASHIPFRTTFLQIQEGPFAALPKSLAVENGAEILRRFEGHDLRLVLQGHLHFDEALSVNRETLLMGGAVCGNWWSGDHLGTRPGFAVLELYPDRVERRYVPFGWEDPVM